MAKFYKLNLLPYNYTVQERNKEGVLVDAVKKFNVCQAIENVMLSPRRQLNGFRQLTVGRVAKRIARCQNDFILLDSVEHGAVKAAFEQGKGYGPNDHELLERIYTMEEVSG